MKVELELGIWRMESDQPIPISLPEEAQAEAIVRQGYLGESNDAYARMHGCLRGADLVGRRLSELLGRSNPRGIELVRAFVRDGYRLLDAEVTIRDAQGCLRWFAVNLTGLVEQGHLVRAWGAQREVLEPQRRIGEEWQATFDAVRDPVVVLDLEYRILRANAAAVAYFGRTPERLAEPSCCTLLHRTAVLPHGCPVRKTIQTKRRSEAELYEPARAAWLHLTADPILDGDGNVTGIVHTLRDITARKEAAAEVDRQLRFERALSGISARMVQAPAERLSSEIRRALSEIKDLFKLDCCGLLGVTAGQDTVTVIETSAGADHAFGLSPATNLALRFPWLHACVVRRGQCFLAHQSGELPEEAPMDRQACREHGIQSLLAIPLSVSAAVTYVIAGVTVDREHGNLEECLPRLRLLGELLASVMQRCQAEVDARRLHGELAHVARFIALGESTAALAHELNQPLTAILSNAQAAQRQLAAGALQPQDLGDILADIVADDQRAGEVIRRVRTSLKKSTVPPQRLDLNRLVREVLQMVGNDALLRQVTIVVDLATDLPAVSGDPIQLQQVLLNLLSNAMDALRETPAASRQLVMFTRPLERGRVQAGVLDRGTGIAPEQLDEIFQPFTTTKAGGLGMGLSICRSIVHLHRGTIRALNNPDGGATVEFTLPAAGDPPPL